MYPNLIAREAPEEFEKLFTDSGGRARDEGQQLDEDLPSADGVVIGLD